MSCPSGSTLFANVSVCLYRADRGLLYTDLFDICILNEEHMCYIDQPFYSKSIKWAE